MASQKERPSRFALTAPYIRRALDEVALRDPKIGKVVNRYGYPKPRRRPASFDSLVRIVVGQQLSTKAAATIYGRLEEAVSGDVTAESILALRAARLRELGFSGRKTEYVRGVASAVERGELDVDGLRRMSDVEVTEKLTALRGFGKWSAEIYLMFALGRTDVWPVNDLGVQKGMTLIHNKRAAYTSKTLIRIGKRYRPERSAVALLSWHVVNNPTL